MQIQSVKLRIAFFDRVNARTNLWRLKIAGTRDTEYTNSYVAESTGDVREALNIKISLRRDEIIRPPIQYTSLIHFPPHPKGAG